MRILTITAGSETVEAALRSTPTADAVWAAAPFSSSAQTWGDEVYFSAPAATAAVAEEADAKQVLELGEVAFWLAGSCIALAFGPTPVSRGDEIRLASTANIWADADPGRLRALKSVAAGDPVRVARG